METGSPENLSEPAEHRAGERLDSWKEIAAYLKREVRTVRRWETAEGLPVHRHMHKKRGTVYAYRAELDAWWNDGRPRLEQQEQALAAARRRRLPWLTAASILAATVVAVVFALNIGGWRERIFGGGSKPIRSLAVLPLENLSGDPEQEYFADGMTEALITELGKISALRVISRQSVMRYKDTDKPVPEIARELNVDAVVEGSVLRDGERVRIAAQLVQAAPERHLWAESYERDLSDVLALQGEVARAIAREIKVAVTPAEETRLASARPVNPEAYEAYLKGRYNMEKWSVDARKTATRYFQQAIEIDPDYALAYAGLAEAYNLQAGAAIPREEAIPRARAAAKRALEIDDTLGEAHASLAIIRVLRDWDWVGAEQEFKRAIELNPNDPNAHHWYMHYLIWMGRTRDSLDPSQRALELDPLSPTMNSQLGEYYVFTRQYDRAIAQFRKTQTMDPNFFPMYRFFGRAYLGKGMYREAIAVLQDAVTLSGGDPDRVADLGYAYAVAGKRREALKVLDELKERSKHMNVPPFSIAVVYAGLGDEDQALEWLGKAHEERSWWMVTLNEFHAFDNLRSDSRFQELVRRMNFPE